MDSSLRFGAKIKKKISQSRKGAKGIGSPFAALRLCERYKKNSFAAADEKKKLTPRNAAGKATLSVAMNF
jgi:hypothetical protein